MSGVALLVEYSTDGCRGGGGGVRRSGEEDRAGGALTKGFMLSVRTGESLAMRAASGAGSPSPRRSPSCSRFRVRRHSTTRGLE